MTGKKTEKRITQMVAPRTDIDAKDGQPTLRVMNTPATEDRTILPAKLDSGISTDVLKQESNKPASKKPGNKTAKNRARQKPKVSENVFDLNKGSRGIDTLLRNAYRSQLDMLALAATKANIMISLNGLLMSMLIISGTHLVSINGLYIIPIIVFLITCATATTFAVFAARPEISRSKFSMNDFMRDEARLLVFEEFSDLRESEYIEAMTTMLTNPQRVYRSMIAHIHDLGVTADKKYRFLYYSYTSFMAGTIITVLSLVTLVALNWYGEFLLSPALPS